MICKDDDYKQDDDDNENYKYESDDDNYFYHHIYEFAPLSLPQMWTIEKFGLIRSNWLIF